MLGPQNVFHAGAPIRLFSSRWFVSGVLVMFFSWSRVSMLVWNECHEGHGCNRHAMFEDNKHVFSSFFPSWIYIYIYILKKLDFLLRNLPSWDPNLRGIDSWPSHDEAKYQGFNSIQKPLQKASSMPPLARGGQWLQFRNDRAWSWTSLIFAWQDCMPQQET